MISVEAKAVNHLETQRNGDLSPSRSKIVDALGLAGWLVLSFAAAIPGAAFPVGEWYAALNRPSIAPPNEVFGPVWTLLYILMGTSAWLIWRRDKEPTRTIALCFFVIQLLFNSIWSWLFFGLHRIDLALLEIVLLVVLIGLTTVFFWRLRRLAGALLMPYLAWVSFATVLNFRFWQLNP